MEGTWRGYWNNWTANNSRSLHSVDFDGGVCALVLTVKPPPTAEPKAPGARVVDAEGKRFLRVPGPFLDPEDAWCEVGGTIGGRTKWAFLSQPVRIIDGDPDWYPWGDE